MLKAPIPKNETERLITLNEYRVLDTLQEKQLDEITKSAALICDCKISLISLIDKDRQWFKSKHCLGADETPRDISYCGHAIMGDDLYIVEDAELDERFCDNPLFLGEPHVRFYAGAPLIAPNGHIIGTLCVIDSEAKSLDEKQKLILKVLSKQIINIFETRKLISTDITQLKNSQDQKLNELNEILSATPSCLKIINAQGELLDMNAQGLSLLEADNFDSVKGANVYDIIAAEHRVKFKKFNEKICSGEKDSLVFEIVGLKGTKRWMETYAAPYKLINGDLAHIAITNDITQKVLAEREYAKQKAIAQHHAKLASIGELAAGVGHEINNPLAIVKGYLSIVENRIEKNNLQPNELQTYLDKINIATDRIARIVEGLRTFSRSDSSEVAEFSPQQAVEESFNMVNQIYESDGIRITLNSDITENFVVNGNRGKFQQVLMNLISNARDATAGKDTRTINISIKTRNEKFLMSVKDNGCGIPESLKDKIFDPFFTTKEVNKGTGIGLSLVHSFIKEANGTIRVDSEEKKGSLFTIELPVLVQTQTQTQTQAQAQAQAQYKVSAILADDEEELRHLLTDMLKDLGIEITAVENGKQAYDLYLKEPEKFDLIISDIKMPEMDGPTLLKSLRERSDLKQPKFIFITGGININFEDKENEINKLIDGYFFKPFDEQEIFEILEECLGEKLKKVA